jgi:hypothetical protein
MCLRAAREPLLALRQQHIYACAGRACVRLVSESQYVTVPFVVRRALRSATSSSWSKPSAQHRAATSLSTCTGPMGSACARAQMSQS